jgi:hypothetical protein
MTKTNQTETDWEATFAQLRRDAEHYRGLVERLRDELTACQLERDALKRENRALAVKVIWAEAHIERSMESPGSVSRE